MDIYLRPADVAVLCGGILASLVVGVVYAVKESRHESSSFRYHRGGGKLHPFSVAVSLVVTFESSIFYLGYPSEIYMYGSYYMMQILGLIVGYLMMFFITIPLFYPLQITSVYEYLQMRHESQRVRQMSMWLGNVGNLLYAGIVTFGAATGMEGVTGVSAWIYVVVLTSIAVVYTSLGGIKAVVVTDVVQGVIMIGMIFAVLIYGCIRVGGVSTVIGINRPTGRLQIFDFDPNPYKRHTFWTLAIGYGFMCAGNSLSAPLVQRLNATRSIGDAKKVAAISIPAFVILHILIMFEGLVAYAYFSQKGCDPIASKQISNPNQIIPYLVADLFAGVPGITGLYLSALCSASLSTISSLLSSISAVTSEDFIRQRLKDASEKKLTQLSKLIVVLAGVVCIGLIAGYLMMFFITIPLFYPLQITSVYEYLQMRHESKRVRQMSMWLVIEINRPTGRLQIFDCDPNPYKRHTFWTIAIGNGWMCAGIIFSPPLVQSLNSVRSIGDARKVAAMSIPAFVILQILIMCEGLGAYAYFSLKGCDPIA
ncbi:sodium-coupled monocarboxylate transporter 1-like [Dreissena polymorpha]|uniref:sodium-coupled monocarboxylate transporter 1-like n=1 Tax=Dreissena polymorpha TaxID=45954 RepID=UPI002264606B|nr:sodium-coupled monocarboxylate transporter 1-like [Dreissena polymorpha]